MTCWSMPFQYVGPIRPCSTTSQYSSSLLAATLSALHCIAVGIRWSLSLGITAEEKVKFSNRYCFCWYWYCFSLAAKAALHKFTQSRESLQREKDLLKSVKVSYDLKQRCWWKYWLMTDILIYCRIMICLVTFLGKWKCLSPRLINISADKRDH